MTDLVARARMRAKMIHDGDYREPVDGYLTSTMLMEAAAELERLRLELAEMKEQANEHQGRRSGD